MSWQPYVDNFIGTGKISNAMVLSHEGGIGGASNGFTLSPEERKAIITGFQNPDGVQTSGLKLAGQKYFTIKAGGRSIYLKKQADGAVIVKTNTAILIALYVAPAQAGEVTPIVEGVAEYLLKADH